MTFRLKDKNGKIKELNSNDILTIMFLHGFSGDKEKGMDDMEDIAKNSVKIEGVNDYRRIYGLSCLSEWVSVKVEKREKI